MAAISRPSASIDTATPGDEIGGNHSLDKAVIAGKSMGAMLGLILS